MASRICFQSDKFYTKANILAVNGRQNLLNTRFKRQYSLIRFEFKFYSYELIFSENGLLSIVNCDLGAAFNILLMMFLVFNMTSAFQ